MVRRHFLKNIGAVGVGSSLTLSSFILPETNQEIPDRKFWLETMNKIIHPVLSNLAKGNLKKTMPVETIKGQEEIRRNVTYLEAFGRVLTGISPWLALKDVNGDEKVLQEKYLKMAHDSIREAVTPTAPDYMNFTKGAQPLVDAAFLAHALLKAPKVLWHTLEDETKMNMIAALKSTRSITPYYSNWILFSAMIEAFFLSIDEEWDPMRVDLSLRKFQEWYVGDGHYGDGAEFHWDYYNSYVIQPFLLDIVDVVVAKTGKYKDFQEDIMKNAKRYAEVQEALIAPDGTFPAIGRSITYRFGAFQLLAQMGLRKQLPDSLTAPQVRSALTAVIGKVMESPGNFDENGWLKIGLYGSQPALGEHYISTGSLYLCTAVFLPLGLPASDPFWSSPATKWSSQNIWS